MVAWLLPWNRVTIQVRLYHICKVWKLNKNLDYFPVYRLQLSSLFLIQLIEPPFSVLFQKDFRKTKQIRNWERSSPSLQPLSKEPEERKDVRATPAVQDPKAHTFPETELVTGRGAPCRPVLCNKDISGVRAEGGSTWTYFCSSLTRAVGDGWGMSAYEVMLLWGLGWIHTMSSCGCTYCKTDNIFFRLPLVWNWFKQRQKIIHSWNDCPLCS